ncbi:MAG: arginase [Pyrinomonadaceae bacterium]|nr:arginase [Pyrinomonadaceae bacterium]
MGFEEKHFPGRGKKVGILGVPLGFGAGTVGSELGATAIRLTTFRGNHLIDHIQTLGYEVEDHGDVEIIKPTKPAEEKDNPKYIAEIYESSKNMTTAVKEILSDNKIPVILGGDHSIAAGTFSGVSSHFREQDEEIGLIWFDAHADMNTPETSPSGNTHGMPLATLLGKGEEKMVNLGGFAPKIKPEYCAHIGARDLDIGEKRTIHELGMRDNCFTMSDIDRRGMLGCIEDAIAIASRAEAGYAVTFDVDVIDPRFAPGSGTLVRGGMTYREAHLGLEIIAEKGGMRSFEIVEVNPMLDRSNITSKLAGELILSALGNAIL